MSGYQGTFRGLASYREEDQDLFKGRDHAIRDVCRLIRRRRLTIVCGVPGVGKSSLLQAGVFPALRREGFLPIWIHLRFAGRKRPGLVDDDEPAAPEPHLLEQVRARVEEVLRSEQVDAPLPAAGDSLPEYFAHTPLWGADYALVAPLLVFDQFEEVFTLGRKDRQAEVNQLVEMLGQLCDEREPEASGSAIEPPPPRIVLGLREDYLAELEEHRRSLRGLVDDRYRLGRLNGEEASAVVLAPPGLATPPIAEGIVRYVERENPVRAAEGAPLAQLSIDPALLSLVCDELDRARRKDEAMLSVPAPRADDDPRNKVLTKFYQRAFADRDPGLQVLVEEYLVDNEARTTCSRQHALEIAGVTEAGLKALIEEARIIREDSRFKTPHLELVHDVLVPLAVQSRREREASARQAAFTRGVLRKLMVGAVVALVAAVVYQHEAARRDEAEAARQSVAALQKESDARVQAGGAVMAQVARDALARGDLAAAGSLLLKAKLAFSSSSSAWTADHAVMLARAVDGLADRVAAVDHGHVVAQAVLADAGDNLDTIGEDGSLRSWSLAHPGGSPWPAAEPSAIEPALVLVSAPGRWLVLVDASGAGEVRTRDGRSRSKFAAIRTGAPDDDLRWQGCVTARGDGFAVWDGVAAVRLWTVDDDAVTAATLRGPLFASAVACTNDGFVVATATGWLSVSATGTASPVVPWVAVAPATPVIQLTASEDGRVVAARDVRGVVTLWRDRATVKLPRLPQPSGTIQLSPDGAYLLAVLTNQGSSMRLVAVWSVAAEPRLVFAVQRDLWGRGLTSAVRFDDGLLIVDRGRIEAWSIGTWSLQLSLGSEQRPRGPIADVLHDLQHRLVLAFRNGTVVQVRRFDPAQVEGDHQISPVESTTWPLGDAVGAAPDPQAGLRGAIARAFVFVGVRALRWSANGAVTAALADRTVLAAGTTTMTIAGRAEDAAVSADGALWTCAATRCEAWRAPGVLAAAVKLPAGSPRIAADGGSVEVGGRAFLLPPTPSGPIRRLAPRPVDWLMPVVGGWIAQQADAVVMLTEQGNVPLPGPAGATARPYVSGDGDGIALAHGNQVVIGTAGELRAGQATAVTLGTAPVIAMTGRPGDADRPALGVIDAALQVFTVEAGQPHSRGSVGARPAGSLAVFSPSGRDYALRSAAGPIEVWPVDDARPPDRYDPEGHAVSKLGLSDDRTVVAVADDGLLLWAPGSTRAFFQPGRYTDAVVTNQNLIATAASTIEVYRFGPGPSLVRQGVIPAAFVDVSPLGKRMATPGKDGTEIWPLSANDDEVVDRYRRHDRLGLLKRASGRTVLTSKAAKYAWVRSKRSVYDVLADNAGTEIKGAEDCEAGSHPRFLACLTEDDGLEDWLEIIDADGGRHIAKQRIDGIQLGLQPVTGGDESQVAVAVLVPGGIRVYVWKGGKFRWRLVPGRPRLHVIDDDHVLAMGDDGALQRWPLDGGPPDRAAGGDRVLDVRFQNRDLVVAVGQPGTGVVVSRFSTGVAVRAVVLPESAEVERAVLAPQSGIVVGVTRETGARTWNVADLTPPTPLVTARPRSDASAVAVGTHERHVAIGYSDGGVEVWELAHPSTVYALSTDGAAVSALVFDAAERWLAAVGVDGNVRIWTLDQTTREALATDPAAPHPPLEIARLSTGYTGLRAAIVFGPGPRARALATATATGVVQRWELELDDDVPDDAATAVIDRGVAVDSTVRAARDRDRNSGERWRDEARLRSFASPQDLDEAVDEPP